MPVPVGTVPASIKFSLCQPRDPLQSKGPPDSLGLSQYTGYDLRSQEVSPGPDHATFLAHSRWVSLSTPWQRSPFPSALAPTHLPPASPEVCLFQPHHHHQPPRTLILSLHACTYMQDLPLSKALSSAVSLPRLSPEAGKWRGRLRSGFTSLLFPFTTCPLAHQQTLGFSLGSLVYVFLMLPKGRIWHLLVLARSCWVWTPQLSQAGLCCCLLKVL